MRQQHEDLAESQLQEGVEENPGPQFHRPCQGTKPWLPCDLGKTPQTCQVPPQYHLKGRNKTSVTRILLDQQTRQSCCTCQSFLVSVNTQESSSHFCYTKETYLHLNKKERIRRILPRDLKVSACFSVHALHIKGFLTVDILNAKYLKHNN